MKELSPGDPSSFLSLLVSLPTSTLRGVFFLLAKCSGPRSAGAVTVTLYTPVRAVFFRRAGRMRPSLCGILFLPLSHNELTCPLFCGFSRESQEEKENTPRVHMEEQWPTSHELASLTMSGHCSLPGWKSLTAPTPTPGHNQVFLFICFSFSFSGLYPSDDLGTPNDNLPTFAKSHKDK